MGRLGSFLPLLSRIPCAAADFSCALWFPLPRSHVHPCFTLPVRALDSLFLCVLISRALICRSSQRMDRVSGSMQEDLVLQLPTVLRPLLRPPK
uniref:Uncharacterized protein n=1 Tax=Oryza brachyantha TaxID=4533 RepID=J3LGW0_ORYBR